ncbi:DUF4430 domain-containing protein [Planctomycetaceae bacterium SH139]
MSRQKDAIRPFPASCSLTLIAIMLACGVGCTGTSEEAKTERTDPATSELEGSVIVEFRYPDQRLESLVVSPVRSGDTVLEVMRQIEQPVIAIQGSGRNSLLTQIGEFSNRGAEGWTFYVNGEWADRGIGDYPIQLDDKIEWQYGDFEGQ